MIPNKPYIKSFILTVALAAVLLLTAVCPCTAQPAPTDLGVLASYTGSRAIAINASGLVAGMSYNEEYNSEYDYWYETDSQACVWQPGDTAPTPLPGLTGYTYSLVRDMNESGQIVGTAYNIEESPWGGLTQIGQACLWELGSEGWTVTGLGFLETGHDDSQAYVINASGQIIGNSGESYTENWASFIWDRTNGMQPFTNLPEGSVTLKPAIPSGINDNGWVIGIALAEGGYWNGGVIWDSSIRETIASLGDKEPMAINQSGLVAGSDHGNSEHLFVWDSGTETDLGLPPAHPPVDGAQLMYQYTLPYIVNDNGQILGYGYAYWDIDGDGMVDYEWDIDGDGELEYCGTNCWWVWSNGSYTDLADVVTGEILHVVMNNQGQIAVSTRSTDGTTTAFIWSGTGEAQLLAGLGGSWSVVGVINEAGQMGGESSPEGARPIHACIWSESAPPESSLIVSVDAISRKGRTVNVSVLLTNPSTTAATTVELTDASLGGVTTISRLPLTTKSIKPDGSKLFTLKFYSSSVAPGTASLSIEGTCSLGAFFSTQTVTVP